MLKFDAGSNVLFSKICFLCILGGGIWLFIWIISHGGWLPLGLFVTGVGMYGLIFIQNEFKFSEDSGNRMDDIRKAKSKQIEEKRT